MMLRRTSGDFLVISVTAALSLKPIPADFVKKGKARALAEVSRQSKAVPTEQSQATRGDM